MAREDRAQPRSVWCWRKDVHVERWLIDTRTGRLVEVRRVTPDPKLKTSMAGWAKRCAGVPVAVYTPDGECLVVQRRSRRVYLRDVTATDVRTRWPYSVLSLHTATGTVVRIRDWVWAERFIDAMDDRFLDMLARLAVTPDVALERWNPVGEPTSNE